MIFSKGKFNRIAKERENTISRDEFLEFTKSIWSFKPERAKRVKHPAPFPTELPYRCIQLYTFKNDVIFDPFCGSGSTGVAAIKSNRHFFMTDTNKKYVRIAKERIAEVAKQQKLTR